MLSFSPPWAPWKESGDCGCCWGWQLIPPFAALDPRMLLPRGQLQEKVWGNKGSPVIWLQPHSCQGWPIRSAFGRSTGATFCSCNDSTLDALNKIIFSSGSVTSLLLFLPMLCRDVESSSLLYESDRCPVDKVGFYLPVRKSEHEWRDS